MARRVAQDVGVMPGSPTTDKIFLLSVVEASSYFTTDMARRAYATFYAVYRGVFSGNLDISKQCTIDNFVENKCATEHWVRSPCNYPSIAAKVGCAGEFGGSYADNYKVGVRPAMWLDY